MRESTTDSAAHPVPVATELGACPPGQRTVIRSLVWIWPPDVTSWLDRGISSASEALVSGYRNILILNRILNLASVFLMLSKSVLHIHYQIWMAEFLDATKENCRALTARGTFNYQIQNLKLLSVFYYLPKLAVQCLYSCLSQSTYTTDHISVTGDLLCILNSIFFQLFLFPF